MPTRPRPFWKVKSLSEMDAGEWESLCDGCGRCCLHKLQDEEDDKVYYTNVVCRLLDPWRCRCTRYSDRVQHVPDCVKLDRANVANLHWLPTTCAYRLLREGKHLPPWHPLVSGSLESVHEAGISVRGRVRTEERVDLEHLDDHIISWVKS